jgi:multidrug transporter EmrE-like cation transporter
MTPVALGLVLAAIVLGTCAQLLLKAGTNSVGAFAFTLANALTIGTKLALEPRILGGAACYVVSLAVWILALSRIEVSVAYPMISIGFALNAVLAWWMLGEVVTPIRMLGIGIIIVGVWLVARS